VAAFSGNYQGHKFEEWQGNAAQGSTTLVDRWANWLPKEAMDTLVR
jgi:hypothetical protein